MGKIAETGVDVLEFLYFGEGRGLEVEHQTLVVAQLPHQLIIVFALEAEWPTPYTSESVMKAASPLSSFFRDARYVFNLIFDH